MRGGKHHGQATRFLGSRCLYNFTNSSAVDPTGPFSLEAFAALPCFTLLCLCSVWYWYSFPQNRAPPSQWREPTPYAATGSPGEIWGDARSCLQAHPKQEDLSHFLTPLIACCRSLKLVLLGRVLVFVCGLKKKARMG